MRIVRANRCACISRWQSLARRGASASESPSLSLPELPLHVSGLSARRQCCPDLPSGQRAGGAVVSVGPQLWATSLALSSLGVPLSKTEVYEKVQAVAARVPGLKRAQVCGAIKTKALGAGLTSVRCAGQWLHLGLSVEAFSGLVLTIDEFRPLVATEADGSLAAVGVTPALPARCCSPKRDNRHAGQSPPPPVFRSLGLVGSADALSQMARSRAGADGRHE